MADLFDMLAEFVEEQPVPEAAADVDDDQGLASALAGLDESLFALGDLRRARELLTPGGEPAAVELVRRGTLARRAGALADVDTRAKGRGRAGR